MKWLCSFVLAMIIILSGSLSYAGSGVKLLSVEIGARPSGMGGAFTAVSNDPYSGAYNPASPCGIGPLAASVGYNSYWENIRLENVYASFEKKSITYSAGVNFAVVDDIQGRGNTATSTYYPFDAHDISFKTGLSMKLDKNIAVGFMAGWIFEKIEAYRGSAFNIDIGLLAQLTSKLNIGLAGMNLGPKMQIREEKYQLPYAFRAGAVYKLTKFLPVLDFVIQDDGFHAHLGGEYKIGNNFLLRGGYRTGYDTKDISFGAGFVKEKFRIDYAFVPYKKDPGDSHLFSLTYQL